MNIENISNDEITTFAFGMKNGHIVSISDVEKGLACNCECIGCGSPLIARKGEIKAHHFAHHDGNQNNCNESILHKLGKQIIQDSNKVGIHPLIIEVSQKDVVGRYHSKTFNDKKYTLKFDDVIPEKSTGSFQPDLTCTTGNHVIFIEIVVSNGVSDEKAEKIKEYGVPVLVIDLSELSAMSDFESIKKSIIYDAPRYWVYHSDHEKKQQDLINELALEIELINHKIKSLVMTKYNLTDKNTLQNTGSLSPRSNQVLLLGFSSGYGYSHKKGRDFDCSLLMCGKPLKGSSSTNYTARGNGGYEIDKISFDEKLIPKLNMMSFPCIVEFNFKMVAVYGRPQMVVSDILFEKNDF